MPPDKRLTALLVDRDPDARRMYGDFLSFAAAYQIDEAEDGREALAMALTNAPDLVISDTRLPGMSGLELCEVLRADPSTAALPIVFVTGDAHPADIRRAEAAGADTVLIKPCLPQTLQREIQRLLGQSAQLRERARQARHRLPMQVEPAKPLMAMPRAHQRVTLMRLHARRQTTTPSVLPPSLMCPVCTQPLRYEYSHVGGVNAKLTEQWDYFECRAGCGAFQYRQRTRKLKRVV